FRSYGSLLVWAKRNVPTTSSPSCPACGGEQAAGGHGAQERAFAHSTNARWPWSGQGRNRVSAAELALERGTASQEFNSSRTCSPARAGEGWAEDDMETRAH